MEQDCRQLGGREFRQAALNTLKAVVFKVEAKFLQRLKPMDAFMDVSWMEN